MNVVIIGLGAISGEHIGGILSAASLYGVCDIVGEKADAAADKCNCKAFYSIDDVLDDDNVDAVHICTPHYLHKSMAVAASEKGRAVVVEKPAVMNFGEFTELFDVIERNKTKLMVVLQNRYNPCIMKLREIYQNPDFGKLIAVKGILTWKRDREYYLSSDWRGKYATEGGGLIINQAPHILDLIALLGGEVERTEATAVTRFLSDVIEVEDTAEAAIFFKNGVKGFFYGTNGFPVNSPYFLELTYEKIVLRYDYGKLFLISDGKFTELASDQTGKAEKGEKFYWGNSHSYVINNFYNCGEYPTLKDYEPVCKIMDKIIHN